MKRVELSTEEEDWWVEERRAGTNSGRASAGDEAILNIAFRLDYAVLKTKAWDIELEYGDTLYIPPEPKSVLVLGAVRNGTALLHAGETRDWRRTSRTRETDFDRVYILKPDGSTIANFPKLHAIETGDTIIVPLSTEPKYRTLPLLRDIATILTGFALPVATIVASVK